MSRERNGLDRQSKSKRYVIKKGIGCNSCSNNKMFDDGAKQKCTSCKRFQ